MKKEFMSQIENVYVDEIYESISEIENLLTDRISDLYDVKGGMQARHAYMYYRSLMYSLDALIRNNLKDVK